jgi:hypothetical protein
MTRAADIAAAADATVNAWPKVPAKDRNDLIARLKARGVVRPCQSDGYTVDLGDGLPTWRSDLDSVARLLLGHVD